MDMAGITTGQRLAAEDRVFAYLAGNFTYEAAVAIANRVEFLLAARWENRQEELRKSSYEGTVFEISIAEMAQSHYRFRVTPPGHSDALGEQHVIDLLSEFPADQAWHIARKVRGQIEGSRYYIRTTARRACAPAKHPDCLNLTEETVNAWACLKRRRSWNLAEVGMTYCVRQRLKISPPKVLIPGFRR